MIRPRTIILGVLVGLGFFVALTYGNVARATEVPKRLPPCHACTTTVQHDASKILTTSNGEPVTETNQPSTAQVKVLGNGVEVTLPDNLAKAGYTVTVEPVLLSAIARLEYQTWQLNPATVALPSLNLTLDYNGPGTDAEHAGGFATLVYEPYQDGRAIHPNQWQTWDALRNGDAKWWSTRPLALLPGNGQQASPQSWSDILVKYPNAVMVAWGVNFGKGSAGAHAVWGHVTIGTINWCVTTKWTNTSPPPSGSPTPTPSQSTPSPQPTTPSPNPTTPSPDATTPTPGPEPTTPDATPIAGAGDNGGIGTGGQLAKTGFNTTGTVLIGSALIAGGALLALVAWRRRRTFVA